MTREEILNMEAGREMDAAVAEHVMGWRWEDGRGTGGPSYWDGALGEFAVEFEPSTDWGATGAVIGKMREYGLAFHAKGWIKTSDVEVRFSDWYAANGGSGKAVYAIASSFLLAVCRAALLAVMEDDNEPL